MRKPRAGWVRTGWHASAAGGDVIEYTLHLPLGSRIIVFRSRRGAPWHWRFGFTFVYGEDDLSRPYETARTAMLAAETAAAAELLRMLAMLGGRAPPSSRRRR